MGSAQSDNGPLARWITTLTALIALILAAIELYQKLPMFSNPCKPNAIYDIEQGDPIDVRGCDLRMSLTYGFAEKERYAHLEVVTSTQQFPTELKYFERDRPARKDVSSSAGRFRVGLVELLSARTARVEVAYLGNAQ